MRHDHTLGFECTDCKPMDDVTCTSLFIPVVLTDIMLAYLKPGPFLKKMGLMGIKKPSQLQYHDYDSAK